MASSIGEFQVLLRNEFLSGRFAVGVIDASELVEGILVASFGRNLPVTDCDFMIAKVIFGKTENVAGYHVSSQCPYSAKQSDPFSIDGYSVTLLEVDIPNVEASFRRTQFDGPDVVIKCLQVISGYSMFAPRLNNAHQFKSSVIVLQTP